MKKEHSYIIYLFWIIAILLTVTVFLTKTSAYKEKNIYYDEQIEASNLAQSCFDEIKQYKITNDLLSPYDKYSCGMIGKAQTNDNTEVTTTMGDINAKLTACNPNFAALYIEYFRQAGIKKGDQVAICCSGSFPTLNISALCACQVFGLEVCFMPSIGASSYGANDASFTFFDMAELLYKKGLINYRIDYISFGGDNDTGYEFIDSISWIVEDPVPYEESPYYLIKQRIDASGISFLSIKDYEENINKRMELIFEKCPDCKLLISVGGNIMTMGINDSAENSYKGLITKKISYLKKQDSKNFGLMDRFLLLDKPVIQMLNIKGICLDNGISYNPDVIPEIGTGNMYYQYNYNIVLPIIMLVITIGLSITYCIYRNKLKKENDSIH